MVKVQDGIVFARKQSEYYERQAKNLRDYITELTIHGVQKGMDEEVYQYLKELAQIQKDHVARYAWWHNQVVGMIAAKMAADSQ
jgi:monomeric isocitrate dehydrogenase